jgi:hypothetical protein
MTENKKQELVKEVVQNTINQLDVLFKNITSKKDREDEIHSIDYFKLVNLDY